MSADFLEKIGLKKPKANKAEAPKGADERETNTIKTLEDAEGRISAAKSISSILGVIEECNDAGVELLNSEGKPVSKAELNAAMLAIKSRITGHVDIEAKNSKKHLNDPVLADVQNIPVLFDAYQKLKASEPLNKEKKGSQESKNVRPQKRTEAMVKKDALEYARRINTMNAKDIANFLNLFGPDSKDATLLKVDGSFASMEEVLDAREAWKKKFVLKRELMPEEEAKLDNIPILGKKYEELRHSEDKNVA